MAFFYATRTQQITDNIKEHQLMKFTNAKARERYIEAEGATKIGAREANRLQPAGVWQTYTSKTANCIFHAVRLMGA